MTPRAVPYPPVASAPVLQWVSTEESGGMRDAPYSLSRRSDSLVSWCILRASVRRTAFRSASWAICSAARIIRSTAHCRLTAVGLAAANSRAASCRTARSDSRSAASRTAAASAMP